MTDLQIFLTITVIALTTILTRALPFILFPDNKPTPAFIIYLGQVLPYAIIGMLVIFCFKSISLISWPYGIPEFLAGLFVVVMHKWKHNLMLSIGGGTILYMILVQLVFV